ncbi:MAG: UvrB/UvrC motif-containing protein [Spirochaetota bacterium]
MKCEVCGEREASVHVQQIMGNEVTELHLCDNCAHEKGIASKEEGVELSLSELLTGLVEIKSTVKEDKAKLFCPACNMQFNDFRKEGRLGCPQCYSAFRKEIALLLDNIAGTSRHKGKLPGKLITYKTILIDKEVMKQKLQEAVKNEDYESAAALRDRIHELEQKCGD